MTYADEIAGECGFDSAWDMIKTHVDTDELLELLCELLHDDTQKGSDILLDWVKEIAHDKYEWFDREAAQAAADDHAYDSWKDAQLDRYYDSLDDGDVGC
tara:strand:+ start:55 stop:354 length:300 start_codon:yes stop_codon:yes gene_type:complete